MLDFIIKLGGSAITDKTCDSVARDDAIIECVDILSDCFKSGKKFIVLHGAGSFGHPLASKHRLNCGYSEEDSEARLALAQIRTSIGKLNRIIVNAFLERGVPAVTVSTFETWTTRHGKLVEHSTWPVGRLLKGGFLPILHGDWVFDEAQGSAVLSSDILAEVLSEEFLPKRIMFVTDCGCLLTHPPGHPDSKPMKEVVITSDCCNTSDTVSTDYKTSVLVPDVTGGISSKVKVASSIAKKFTGSTCVFFCPVGGVMRSLCDLEEMRGGDVMTEFVCEKSCSLVNLNEFE